MLPLQWYWLFSSVPSHSAGIGEGGEEPDYSDAGSGLRLGTEKERKKSARIIKWDEQTKQNKEQKTNRRCVRIQLAGKNGTTQPTP